MQFLNAKTALSQFVWLLPDGVQVSIDTFSLNVTQIQQPVGLNSTMKNSILKLINNLQTDSSSSIQGLGPALDRALQMFRSGMEIILITAASETPTDFALKVNQFKSNLVGPYVVALTSKTVELMADLAQLGASYFVPPGSVSKTWMVDTLQSIYSLTTSRYRIKVNQLINILHQN